MYDQGHVNINHHFNHDETYKNVQCLSQYHRLEEKKRDIICLQASAYEKANHV